jgi:hypothetical protein
VRKTGTSRGAVVYGVSGRLEQEDNKRQHTTRNRASRDTQQTTRQDTTFAVPAWKKKVSEPRKTGTSRGAVVPGVSGRLEQED